MEGEVCLNRKRGGLGLAVFRFGFNCAVVFD